MKAKTFPNAPLLLAILTPKGMSRSRGGVGIDGARDYSGPYREWGRYRLVSNALLTGFVIRLGHLLSCL